MYSHEFSNNRVLQWALGALVFGYFGAFSGWIGAASLTKEAYEFLWYVCPPYFQSCGEWYGLSVLPYGYTQTILYMVFFAAMFFAVYKIAKGQWWEAQLTLIPIFIWHAAGTLLLTDQLGGNYEYYLIGFGLILLFFPHKEFFLKLLIVWFYVLSTVAKIHPAWIEGGYFTNLRDGLPLFPDWSIPLFTNFVILMEMVGSWFLFSKNRILQRGALIFFTIFHLYSGILVEYRYPATVLPFLLILFGPWYRHTPIPFTRRSLIGWAFIVLLLFLQLSPKMIPGDEKLTMEGNKYGLYMFESNHQCISEAEIYLIDGSMSTSTRISTNARNRCDPYPYWFYFTQLCARTNDIERISWTFDHSVNGGPFLRIVDEKNICAVDYKPFRHNEWIKTEKDNPPVIGFPVRNVYY